MLVPEFGDEILSKPACSIFFIELDKTAGAVPVVIPSWVVHDRIKADAEDVRTFPLRLSHLGADISEPTRPRTAFRAGFAEEQGASVELPNFEEHAMEWTMLRVAKGNSLAVMHPLIVPVVVNADDVERRLRADGLVPQQIPCLVLSGSVQPRGGAIFGSRAIGNDVDDGLRLNKPGARIYGANGAYSSYRSSDQLLLEFGTTALRVRVEGLDVSADPSPEGDLVDGAEKRDRIGVAVDQRRGGVGKVREPVDEIRRKDVEVRRQSPMAEIPDDLCPRVDARLEHGKEARPVVDTGLLLDEVPAKAVAHGEDADLLEESKIGFCKEIVPCATNQIHLPPIGAAVGRAFKAAGEKACEWGFHLCGRYLLLRRR